MFAMQYAARLPTGYELERLQARIAERRHLFDNLEGLTHKSFLYNRRQNIYAPFYVWHDSEAARKFLLGDLFDGVIRGFGRPRVRRWTLLSCGPGDRSRKPTFAAYEIDKVDSDMRLADLSDREAATHREMMGKPGIYAYIIGLDPDRWEIARFSLWHERDQMPATAADCVQGYRVLHVSEPAAAPQEWSSLAAG